MLVRTMRRNQSGFTLIEVLLVVTYIAVIALIVIPKFSGVQRRANEAAMRATLRILRDGVASYQAETGAFPARVDDLVAPSVPATGLNSDGTEVAIVPADWRGPYVRYANGQVPVDRVTGQRSWAYQTNPPHVSQLNSLAEGDGMDGVPYSRY